MSQYIYFTNILNESEICIINKHKQPNLLKIQLGMLQSDSANRKKLLNYYSKTDCIGLQKQFYTHKHDIAKQDINSKS